MIITIVLCILSFFFGIYLTMYIFKKYVGIDLFEESRKLQKSTNDMVKQMKK